MAITFLFWNLKNNSLETIITNLTRNYHTDILMFVECSIPPEILLKNLNRLSSEYYYAPGIGCERVKIFSRFPYKFLLPVLEDSRLTIRNLNLPGKKSVLLAVTHFSSKKNQSNDSQAMGCTDLANSIKIAERDVGHSRTILVGDLNMNPFEAGMVSANGLHGTMSKKVAQRRSRTIDDREYLFFYNPMWNFLGDATSDAPGTYYYNNSEYVSFFWNMFDQVLIRPDLLPFFKNEYLKILTTDGETSFLTPTGLPNAKKVSDHLPILFKLDL